MKRKAVNNMSKLFNFGKIELGTNDLGYAQKMHEEYQAHMVNVRKSNEEFDKKYNLKNIRL